RVEKPSAEERQAWSRLPFNEEEYRQAEIGSSRLTGEPGFSVQERTWARPTVEVHGIPGGFVGAGGKTVIPARASAKISMRLVPDMRPDEIFKLYSDFVQSIVPKGIEIKIKSFSMADPIVINTDNKYVKASSAAMKDVFNKETVFIRSGGSIPIVADFEKHLKIPSVMMGFGLPDDN